MFFLYILSESKIYKIIKPVIEPVTEPFKSDFLKEFSMWKVNTALVTLEYTCIHIEKPFVGLVEGLYPSTLSHPWPWQDFCPQKIRWQVKASTIHLPYVFSVQVWRSQNDSDIDLNFWLIIIRIFTLRIVKDLLYRGMGILGTGFLYICFWFL